MTTTPPTFDPTSAGTLIGSEGQVVVDVGVHDTAVALGSGDLPILATPRMIALMEAAACAALAGHLPPDLTSVGSHVDVRHLAPTPVGRRITARARIVDVRGARIDFDVTAEEDAPAGSTAIGRGTHTRVVVEREGFAGTR